jgi:hypothetical protein
MARGESLLTGEDVLVLLAVREILNLADLGPLRRVGDDLCLFLTNLAQCLLRPQRMRHQAQGSSHPLGKDH